MGYKLKRHSGASKRFKKTASSVKNRSAGRNHILSKQSTKRKRHKRGLPIKREQFLRCLQN